MTEAGTLDPTQQLDRRLHAYRPDLADIRLKGRVEAARFAEGRRRRVTVPSTPIRAEPRPDVGLTSEAFFGETVLVFEETEGWAWGQLETDGYVGWLSSDALSEPGSEPTHRVAALRTFVYPGPDMKLAPLGWLSLGSRVSPGEEIVTRGTAYRMLATGGAVVSRHLEPVSAAPAEDFVTVAETFLHTPYLWGGRTSLGLDCSGLVQLSLMMSGIAAPRDTDQQERALGSPVEGGADGLLLRGDLVFWRGHVGIMADRETLLHANGFHMAVVRERLAEAVARTAAAGIPPPTVRRLRS